MKKLKYDHTDTSGHKWSFYRLGLGESQGDTIVALSLSRMSALICTADDLTDDERIYNLQKKIDR